MGKWFSADVMCLALPIGYALVAFSTTISRAFLVDPEWTQTGMEYYESNEAVEDGKTYRSQISKHFQSGKTGVFNNNFEGETK